MKACIGRDLAGENARSHARFDLSSSYEAVAAATAFPELLAYAGYKRAMKSTCIRHAQKRPRTQSLAVEEGAATWSVSRVRNSRFKKHHTTTYLLSCVEVAMIETGRNTNKSVW